jgi:hypothetical protein
MAPRTAAVLLAAAVAAACSHGSTSGPGSGAAEPCAGFHGSLEGLERASCAGAGGALLLHYTMSGVTGAEGAQLCESGVLSWFRGADSARIRLETAQVRSFLESLGLEQLDRVPARVELSRASNLPSTCVVWREGDQLRAIWVHGALKGSPPAPPPIVSTVERIRAFDPWPSP